MPEEQDLNNKISDLEKLMQQMIVANKRPDAVTESRKYLGWLQSVIALVVVVIGLGINWGITTTKMGVIENTQKEQKLQHNSEINKLQHDVHELQLKQAKDDQLLVTIKEDVKEIKRNVEALAERIP